MANTQTHTTERRHAPDRRAAARTSTTHLSAADWVAMTLLIIGGLNWGLIGLFNFNLVSALFGEMSALTRVVYTLVGLSALYSIYTTFKMGSKQH